MAGYKEMWQIKAWISKKISSSAVHLDVQSSALNLRRALLDNERDAVWAVP